MKEGGGGDLGKSQLCVCTFGSVSVFAWLARPEYPRPLGLCTFYLCCFFLLLHFHFHFPTFHSVQLTPKRSDYIGGNLEFCLLSLVNAGKGKIVVGG